MNALRLTSRTSAGRVPFGSAARGFTLIEVLISLVILGVGLLGLGLLQATSLKASYSSNQRTIATNLAYQVIDMMRAKHVQAYQYTSIQPGVFPRPANCARIVYPSTGNLAGDDIASWECQVTQDLGQLATAQVFFPDGAAGRIRVVISWTDQRFTATTANEQSNAFTVVSAL